MKNKFNEAICAEGMAKNMQKCPNPHCKCENCQCGENCQCAPGVPCPCGCDCHLM